MGIQFPLFLLNNPKGKIKQQNLISPLIFCSEISVLSVTLNGFTATISDYRCSAVLGCDWNSFLKSAALVATHDLYSHYVKSISHDVDAAVLKKVILTDGAVVTVKGAISVSLRHPVELPLPLNRPNNGFASGLLTLAERLQEHARCQDDPLFSLRIVGPTSLTSPASSSPSSSNRLKLKRLAPGLVELSSASKKRKIKADAVSAIDSQVQATALLAPNHFSTLWPVESINISNSNLLGFEASLSSVLGPRANKEGSFKLLNADVSAQTFVKIGFGVEKKLKEGDGSWA